MTWSSQTVERSIASKYKQIHTLVIVTDTLSSNVVVTRCLEVWHLGVNSVTKFTKVTNNWRCWTSE